MSAPKFLKESGEIFLNLGEFYFHHPELRCPQPKAIGTLLGPCVSVVLWHPERRLAAMSHSVLPGRGMQHASSYLDGRFSDEAVQLLVAEILRAKALPAQFQVCIIGGGQMYSIEKGTASIGDRNIEVTRRCLLAEGFQIRNEHVGREGHRKVRLDLGNGQVTIAFGNQRINL